MIFHRIKSIRLKIIYVFSLCFLVLLSLIVMTNKLYFRDYYIDRNEEKIRNVVQSVEGLYKRSEVNEFVRITVRETGSRIEIFDKDSQSIIRSRLAGYKPLVNEKELAELRTGAKKEKDGYYKIFERDMLINHRVIYAKYIGDGDLLVIVRPLGFVLEATEMSNAFLTRVAIVVYIVCLILIFFISKCLSMPLLRVLNISKKMADLDFEEKLVVKGTGEFAALNRYINSLAEKLHDNIEELNITNEQLEIELNKEKSLESMRRQFVSDVSHELKNPLSVIIAYANGLLVGIPEEEKEIFEYYNIISDEASKMNLLVKDLLDLSGYESGMFLLKKEPVMINEIIEDVLEKFQYQQSNKSITVHKEYERVEVYGDRLRLSQVVINLLQNAFKYSNNEGEMRITVINENNEIALLIENSGDLIPNESLDKIWGSFYQVDTEKKGNGLGLAIVKSIVTLHDGSVSAFTKNSMNCFEIILPNIIEK